MLPVLLLTLVITSLLDPRYPGSSGIVQTLLRDGASEAWSDVITKFGKSKASSDIYNEALPKAEGSSDTIMKHFQRQKCQVI